MILGMSTASFTLLHVIISLIGIASGFLVVYGLFKSKRFDGGTAIFLLTTVLTSLTGYLFPNEHITPGQIVGAISLVTLAIAIIARYPMHMAGAWRSIYVITAVVALYLNTFVLVAQCFAKIPALHALAPTQNDPPFLIAQGVVLVAFLVIGTLAVKKFHIEPAAGAEAWRNTKAS